MKFEPDNEISTIRCIVLLDWTLRPSKNYLYLRMWPVFTKIVSYWVNSSPVGDLVTKSKQLLQFVD